MRASLKNNPSDELTGVLFLYQYYLLRVLEGECEQVLAAYSRIAPDPRHKNPFIIGVGPIKARVLGKWSMGLFDSSLASSRIVEQYTGSPKFDPKLLSSAAAFNMMQALLNSRKAAAWFQKLLMLTPLDLGKFYHQYNNVRNILLSFYSPYSFRARTRKFTIDSNILRSVWL